jgi:hypothetical protein
MLKLFVHALSKLIQNLRNMIHYVFILNVHFPCPKFIFLDIKPLMGKLSCFAREVWNNLLLLIIKCHVSIKIIKGAIPI